MPLRWRTRYEPFDVPVQDLILRITGPEDLYEEARAVGMQFWEQIQSYSIRNPDFRISKRPIDSPEGAPEVVRRMITEAAVAGVGPMFTFQAALTEEVGRRLAERLGDVIVSCGGDHFVVAHRRARLPVHPAGRHGSALAIVVKPELGPQGIHTTTGGDLPAGAAADGLVVVARSCILAAAAATAASAILSKPDSLRMTLSYLQQMQGVHGAVVVRGERIGVAGNLELAA
jgi:ApbE superfamily uncharacterized protein (UPF0280 family)